MLIAINFYYCVLVFVDYISGFSKKVYYFLFLRFISTKILKRTINDDNFFFSEKLKVFLHFKSYFQEINY